MSEDKGTKCDKPHQSGMEQQHEKWVLAMLNFMNSRCIPFYICGDKSRGTFEFEARLGLLGNKIDEANRDAIQQRQKNRDLEEKISSMFTEMRELRDELERKQQAIEQAYAAMTPEDGPCRYGEAIMLLDSEIANPEETTDASVQEMQPEERRGDQPPNT